MEKDLDYGEFTPTLLKSFGHRGSSSKTAQPCLIADLHPFCKISAKSGTMRNGIAYQHPASARPTNAKGYSLWPTPTTGAPLCGGTGAFKKMKKLMQMGVISETEMKSLTSGGGGKSNPALMEWLLGYPVGYTELDS